MELSTCCYEVKASMLSINQTSEDSSLSPKEEKEMNDIEALNEKVKKRKACQ